MKKNDAVQNKDAVKEVKATPLYKAYLSAYNAESKAINKTADQIETIKATGLTLPEFFTLLWSENYKVPETWPLNTQGLPLSPLSSKTRAAVPEVNRLVSAMAMRSKREVDKKESPKKETSKKETSEKETSDLDGNDNDGPGAQIASFDKMLCVKQLQALLVRSFEVPEDQVIYDLAKKLVQLLLDKK